MGGRWRPRGHRKPRVEFGATLPRVEAQYSVGLAVETRGNRTRDRDARRRNGNELTFRHGMVEAMALLVEGEATKVAEAEAKEVDSKVKKVE